MLNPDLNNDESNNNNNNNNNEIEKILEDERARCEQHKNNYTLLKIENQKIRQEYASLQDEMRQILIECNQFKDASEKSVEMASKALSHKQTEIENLRQLLAANSPNVLRHAIKKEFEAAIETQMKETEEELEKIRTERQQLRYDNAVLKTQLETNELSRRREMQELRIKTDLELRNLTDARDNLSRELSKIKSPSASVENSKKLRESQKELNQIKSQIASLKNELKDAINSKEIAKMQAENSTRNLTKLNAEQLTKIRNLEANRSSLQLRLDSLQNDFANIKQENLKLTMEVNARKKETLQLRDELSKTVHEREIESSEAKIINAQLKTEFEKELEKANAKLSCSELSLEMTKENYSKLEQTFKDRENSFKTTIQSLRNQEKEANQKALDFEIELKEVTHAKSLMESDIKTKDSKLENALKELKETKMKLEKESTQLKLLNQNNSELENGLTQRQLDIKILNEHLTKEKEKMNEVQRRENELKEQYQSLKENFQKITEELERTKTQLVDERQVSEKLLKDKIEDWERERNQLILKIEKAEKITLSENIALCNEISEYKKKIKDLNKTITKLNVKTEKLEVEKKEIESESVPLKKYQLLHLQFEDLQRKQQEFKTILLTNPLNTNFSNY